MCTHMNTRLFKWTALVIILVFIILTEMTKVICLLLYYISVPGLNKIAKKLDIDCAPAMVGWEQHAVFAHPL